MTNRRRLCASGVLVTPSFSTTPFAVNRTDNTLVQTLLTTGRASLSAKDASSGPDRAVFAALRTEIRRASSNKANPTSTACDSFSKREAADNDTATTPPVFPRDGEFHRRTGKIRRQKIRSKRCKAQAKGKEEEDGRGVYSGGGSKEGSGWRQGPDGLTATTGKVEWFCGALAKTAERLSGRTRGGAEAFLLSVFEDFDRRAACDGVRNRAFGRHLRGRARDALEGRCPSVSLRDGVPLFP